MHGKNYGMDSIRITVDPSFLIEPTCAACTMNAVSATAGPLPLIVNRAKKKTYIQCYGMNRAHTFF